MNLGAWRGRDVIFPEAPPAEYGKNMEESWTLPVAWAVAGCLTQTLGTAVVCKGKVQTEPKLVLVN